MPFDPDVLVISPALRSDRIQKRSPLRRLILPIDKIPVQLLRPAGSAWWAERQGSKLWLRGFGKVEQVSEGIGVETHTNRRAVWHLSPSTAERLTLPGKSGPESANIATLANDCLSANPNDFWIGTISFGLQSELQRRRLNLAESAWSYTAACRHLAHLMRQTNLQRTATDLRGDFDNAWSFAKTEFARAELVKVDGRDEFEVAAAVLAGCEKMPPNWGPSSSAEVFSLKQDVRAFHELDLANTGCNAAGWNRNSQSQLPTDALERASRRHQEILKLMGRTLATYGLHPTYSRLVDLRVELPRYEVFFEVKTATRENFLQQVRLATGQLLEYCFRGRRQDGDQPIRLVAVVERAGDIRDVQFAEDFLKSLGIRLVLWNGDNSEFEGLQTTLC